MKHVPLRTRTASCLSRDVSQLPGAANPGGLSNGLESTQVVNARFYLQFPTKVPGSYEWPLLGEAVYPFILSGRFRCVNGNE